MNTSTAAAPDVTATDGDVLLRVENVVKPFPVLSGKLFQRGAPTGRDGVDLAIAVELVAEQVME